ncbi:hypothetical protein KR222_007592 [Zaprionus bogoriensis]|nr:hypothetical protein KR222_007592 [Zaprionus bogoriensis]
MFALDLAFNVGLIGVCGYAFYAMTPADHPYGYTAAAFCFVHGLLSLMRALEDGEDCTRSYDVSTSVVNVIPLPLANIEFYLAGSQADWALVHALSVILLLYDAMGDLGDEEDRPTAMVKDVSLLANIASAAFLGVQDENYFHVGIGVAAAVARFGPDLIDSVLPDLEVGRHVDQLGKACIIGLMTYALTQK